MSMAGVEEGVRDALTRSTRPLTGAYYFIPSIEAIRALATAPDWAPTSFRLGHDP